MKNSLLVVMHVANGMALLGSPHAVDGELQLVALPFGGGELCPHLHIYCKCHETHQREAYQQRAQWPAVECTLHQAGESDAEDNYRSHRDEYQVSEASYYIVQREEEKTPEIAPGAIGNIHSSPPFDITWSLL
jgi:hypothetical protein